jgi:Xaa-Pro aminopeptidase
MKRLEIILIVLTALASLGGASMRAEGSPMSVRVAPPAPVFTDAERQAALAYRREAVVKAMKDKSMLILFSAEPKLYAGDVDYVFRQENNLYYLTALKQPGAALVMTKDSGQVKTYLFVPERSVFAETWTGKMYSNEEAARLSGISTIIPAGEFTSFLSAIKDRRVYDSADGKTHTSFVPTNLYLLLPFTDRDKEGIRQYRRENEFSKQLTGYKLENANISFGDLRQIKSNYEVKLLQHAVDITIEAQESAWLAARSAKMEYEVQAEVEYIFRKRNADYWGYPSIVGCGPNATTLHYDEAQGPVKAGELMLMDVGAEYDHYSADVTRTIPVSGKFTKEQADVYRVVYDAQEAVGNAVKPGVTMQQLEDIADNSLKNGLFDLGLITDKGSDQFRIWFPHGFGHLLGMNVHDVGRNGPPLQAGMTFTNEPGIYVRADALQNLRDTPENRAFIEKVRPAFERYKNIGVRIEDDMLVTPTGAKWMTGELPRKLEDIEAFMAAAGSTPH